jgi:hypothetical protein
VRFDFYFYVQNPKQIAQVLIRGEGEFQTYVCYNILVYIVTQVKSTSPVAFFER